MRKVRFLPAAEAELLHETKYYSKARKGYGVRFNAAVKAATASAVRFPEGGAPAPEDTRKYRVQGFPFNVVYRATNSEILVVAIAPDSKRPEYWLARVRVG